MLCKITRAIIIFVDVCNFVPSFLCKRRNCLLSKPLTLSTTLLVKNTLENTIYFVKASSALHNSTRKSGKSPNSVSVVIEVGRLLHGS